MRLFASFMIGKGIIHKGRRINSSGDGGFGLLYRRWAVEGEASISYAFIFTKDASVMLEFMLGSGKMLSTS